MLILRSIYSFIGLNTRGNGSFAQSVYNKYGIISDNRKESFRWRDILQDISPQTVDKAALVRVYQSHFSFMK